MAGNNSIHVLRGNSVGNRSDILQDGQPLYDRDTRYFYVGTGNAISDTIPISASYANEASYAEHANNADTLVGLTATVAELNYVDGVTSSVQTQLDGKVPTNREINGHVLTSDVTVTKSDVSLGNVPNVDCTNADNITSGTLSANRIPWASNSAKGGIEVEFDGETLYIRNK